MTDRMDGIFFQRLFPCVMQKLQLLSDRRPTATHFYRMLQLLSTLASLCFYWPSMLLLFGGGGRQYMCICRVDVSCRPTAYLRS